MDDITAKLLERARPLGAAAVAAPALWRPRSFPHPLASHTAPRGSLDLGYFRVAAATGVSNACWRSFVILICLIFVYLGDLKCLILLPGARELEAELSEERAS